MQRKGGYILPPRILCLLSVCSAKRAKRVHAKAQKKYTQSKCNAKEVIVFFRVSSTPQRILCETCETGSRKGAKKIHAK
jgi:hypothetical protein